MALRILMLATSLASAVAMAQAPAGIFLSLKFEQAGMPTTSPKVLLQSAVPSEIRIGSQVKVQVTAVSLPDHTDLQLMVYAEEGSGLSLVGTPRVLVGRGQESVVSWSSPSGTSYKLTVKPVLVAPAST